MSIEGGSNHMLLKTMNRMAIVRRLCASPGLSRSELSSDLGLTRSTVTLLVRELMTEGWVAERKGTATGDLGRRPTPLVVDTRRLLLLGAEVGVGRVRAIATSLSGAVFDRVAIDFDPGAGVQSGVDALAAALLGICERATAPGRRFAGIGIGLPGGVDAARAVLRFAPNLGWHDVPFGELLARGLSGSPLAEVPLFLQNEADAAVVGEAEFNAAEACDPMLYLSLDRGLGAGVIVQDKLLAGGHGVAGEVGHIVLEVNGPPCSCGRRGCAEALINARAASGHPEAVAVAGEYLGVLLQNLATIYDPGCFVLGGALVELGDAFLQPALRRLHEHAAAAQVRPPAVRVSRFGADAVPLGAAALARYRLTRPVITNVRGRSQTLTAV